MHLTDSSAHEARRRSYRAEAVEPDATLDASHATHDDTRDTPTHRASRARESRAAVRSLSLSRPLLIFHPSGSVAQGAVSFADPKSDAPFVMKDLEVLLRAISIDKTDPSQILGLKLPVTTRNPRAVHMPDEL